MKREDRVDAIDQDQRDRIQVKRQWKIAITSGKRVKILRENTLSRQIPGMLDEHRLIALKMGRIQLYEANPGAQQQDANRQRPFHDAHPAGLRDHLSLHLPPVGISLVRCRHSYPEGNFRQMAVPLPYPNTPRTGPVHR